MKKEELYDLAIEKYGANMQKVVCMEEMSELVKELSKDIRGAGNIKALTEELADVSIMVEQMIRHYDLQEAVKIEREKKLKRLFNRLTEGGKK